MIKFNDITIDSIDSLKDSLKNNTNICCEYSTANMFAWNVDNNLKYAIVDGQLILRLNEKNVSAYSIPDTGGDIKKIVDLCLEDAKSNGNEIVLRQMSKETKEKIEHLYGNQFIYAFCRDNSDYIYDVSELALLKGKKYHGKKNHINQFVKTYQYEYIKINSENINDCGNMVFEWINNKESEGNQVNNIELNVLSKVFEYYDRLGLVGAMIRIDGKVKAFTIGERLSQDTFVTHFEKADANIRGLYPMINMLFAQNELSEFKYVNREEDMGIPGLRKAKLSYKPVMLWDKYEAMLRQ